VRSGARRGAFTIVESALIVCVVGALLAVATPTFLRTVQTSKIAEASTQLAVLYRASASYYATPRTGEAGTPAFCLAAAAGPTPETPSVNPVPVDFGADETAGSATWRALGFAPQTPLRYRYTFAPTKAGCALPTPGTGVLVVRAEGDLDGDGVLSSFERSASIQVAGELSPDPLLRVRERIE
jgi:type II secretory pathway pseudopilin PulG